MADESSGAWIFVGGLIIGGIATYAIIKYAVIEATTSLITKTIGGVTAAKVDVTVTDKTIGQPIVNSKVIITSDGKKVAEGVTDNLGKVSLSLPGNILPSKFIFTADDPASKRTLTQEVTVDKKTSNTVLFEFQKENAVVIRNGVITVVH